MGVAVSKKSKTEEEIRLLAEAGAIVSGIHAMLKEHIVAGTSTKRLDELAEEFIRDQGGVPAFKGYQVMGAVFPATLCTSINDAVVHGIPGDVLLQEGDMIAVDVGVYKNGFYGDGACTYAIGKVSDQVQQLMTVTREALLLGAEQAIVGNRIYDIARAVQHHVEHNGFSVVRELVGHGIGSSLHEDPAIPNFVPSPFQRHTFKNVALVEGMVICIEPMVNAGKAGVVTLEDEWTVVTRDGMPSAHYEHMVVVRENKPEILTTHIPV